MNENNLQLTDSCNTDVYSYCFLVESGKLSISIFIRFYQLSVAIVFVKNILKALLICLSILHFKLQYWTTWIYLLYL